MKQSVFVLCACVRSVYPRIVFSHVYGLCLVWSVICLWCPVFDVLVTDASCVSEEEVNTGLLLLSDPALLTTLALLRQLSDRESEAE